MFAKDDLRRDLKERFFQPHLPTPDHILTEPTQAHQRALEYELLTDKKNQKAEKQQLFERDGKEREVPLLSGPTWNYLSNIQIRKTKTEADNPPIQRLDAPGIQDDFYYTCMDWSSRDQVAVFLNSATYLQLERKPDGEILKLTYPDEDGIVKASIRFTPDGRRLYTVSGQYIYKHNLESLSSSQQESNLNGSIPDDVVLSSLAFAPGSDCLLSLGTRRGQMLLMDTRQSGVGGRSCRAFGDEQISDASARSKSVCGQSWSENDTHLLAVGYDNNVFRIWDTRQLNAPLVYRRHHKSAIKAIQFHPYRRSWLATGGGTNDRHLCLWDIHKETLLAEHDTGSQITQLSWNRNQHNDLELATAHGYSDNALCLWEYIKHPDGSNPEFQKRQYLQVHENRILSMAVSPLDGMVMTAGSDELICMWDVFTSSSVPIQSLTKDIQLTDARKAQERFVLDSRHLR